MEALDCVLKTIEYGVRRSSRVEPVETVLLDVLDERRGRALAGFDASDLEVVVAGDLPEVLRQRAGVSLALWYERHPVVVGFVFEPNLDAFRDLRRERLEVLTVLVVDVGVRGQPDGVDDAVDDPPAAGFQLLFRRQQNLSSERINRLVALDAAELRVAEPLIAEAGNEDPLQRSRPPFEFSQAVLVGVVSILFATDGRLDLVACVDDRLQHVDEVAPLVADRVPTSASWPTSESVIRPVPVTTIPCSPRIAMKEALESTSGNSA